jgi:L-ascorbate metabolism protein UlaG (beta-lactamase superfamily)
MQIKKLSWAGILVQSGDISVMIDPLGKVPPNQDRPLAARLGEAHEPFVPLESHPIPAAVAITHIHPDHFDPESIQGAFGRDIPVLMPDESTTIVNNSGLTNLIGASPGDSWEFGELKITAVYSADGYGTPQVAWMIEGDGQKIIHCGDTLWHGEWWKIAGKYGPFNLACLPINGAVLNVKGLSEQSTLPACMTPEEAVEAAKILGAALLPIHYGMFHNPPYYSEAYNALKRVEERVNLRGVELYALKPGEWLDLSSNTKNTRCIREEEGHANPTSAMGRGPDRVKQ